jgi:acyl carrier protein/ribosomal protein L21E
MKFMNRFNWIGQQQEKNVEDEPFLLCQSQTKNDLRCSYIYRKKDYKDDTCPICNSYAAIDIYKHSNVQESLSEGALHKLFFGRVGRVYSEMNASIWVSLGSTAWKSSNANEKVFLTFCMAFDEVSGEATDSESDYWDVALKAESEIRKFLIKNKIQIIKNDDFHLDLIADGLMAGKIIRSLQSHYGISICGESFEKSSEDEAERKYQKAIKIAERLTILGCSDKDNLPYFKASEHFSGSK